MSHTDGQQIGLSPANTVYALMGSVSRSRSILYTGAAVILLDKNLGSPGPHFEAERSRRRFQARKLVKTLSALRDCPHHDHPDCGNTNAATDEWTIAVLEERRHCPEWREGLIRLVSFAGAELESYQRSVRAIEADNGGHSSLVTNWASQLGLDESWVQQTYGTLLWIREWCTLKSELSRKQRFKEKMQRLAMRACVVSQSVARTTCKNNPRLRLDEELTKYGAFQKLVLRRVKDGMCVL